MRKRNKIKKAEHCSAFALIHSSLVGRYTGTGYLKHTMIALIHSSLVGRYSNTAQKNRYHILTVLLKIQRFFLSSAPKTLKFPRTGRENASYPGANPPYFLWELPVRTMIIFAIHNRLLHSYHITSSDFMYLLYQNGNN